MMKVEHFKLVDDGISGIIVTGKDSRPKEKFTVWVDASLKFKVPMPEDLVKSIQRLKLFFLQLTGYWEVRYAAFLDEHYNVEDRKDDSVDYLRAVWLFENVTITGLKAVDGYYIITGKIKNPYGQTIGLAAPRVTYESQYSSYDHLVRVGSECINLVEEYVNETKIRLMDSRQFMLDLFKEAEPQDLDKIKHWTDEECEQHQISELEKNGYFVMNTKDLVDNTEEPKEAIFVKSKDEEKSNGKDKQEKEKSTNATKGKPAAGIKPKKEKEVANKDDKKKVNKPEKVTVPDDDEF